MKKIWRQRLLSALLSIFMVLAMTGVSVSVRTQAAENNSTVPSGTVKVHFLDVGQGLSILVQSDGKNLIYDGGDRKTSRFVAAYLKEQGVTKIDYLISSHYDADHMAGLIGCLKSFKVKNVISSNYVHTSKLYRSFVKAVKEDGLKMKHPPVGKSYRLGSASFQILAPETIEAEGSNNNSVAIKLTNKENSFIFTGDAEHESEKAMCNSGIDLNCDVLVPGHHGSATATSWDFLQKTVPEYAVISCGKDNKYGHPDKDTMDKLQSMEIQVYRTDKQGTVTVTSDGKNLNWSAAPCNDYTPGDESDKGTVTEQTVTKQTTQKVTEDQVWVSATGSKYHKTNHCGNMNPDTAKKETKEEAEAQGLKTCGKCY